MVKAWMLVLIFMDGHLGGRTNAAMFLDETKCQRFGMEQARQQTNFGHPATFLCEPRMVDPNAKAKPPAKITLHPDGTLERH